jgi:hypothetical protein
MTATWRESDALRPASRRAAAPPSEARGSRDEGVHGVDSHPI